MKRFALLLPLFAILGLGACSAESKLPVATGKASIRAINGVKTSAEVAFLIEERTIGTAAYRQTTARSRFDDLSYNFNFNALYIGETELRRIAGVPVDIIKDMDYIFVLTGTLADPTILTWETAEREFSGTETAFEARFAHTAPSLGSVDYYFAAPGIDPVAGEAAGTITFGEVLTAVDFEAGEYVLTITSSGMPDQVLYESVTTTFLAATQYIITSFDGDASTFAPFSASAFTTGVDNTAGSIAMPDVNYPPSIEFVNGSMAIGIVDIYKDELLTSQIVSGHGYRAVSDELEFSVGENSLLYTPTTLLSPVLIDDIVTFFSGVRGRVVAFGPSDALEIRSYAPDRRSVETQVKLQLYNAAINYDLVSVYVVDADESIEDVFIPTVLLFASGSAAQLIRLAEGSFDIYITELPATGIDEKQILAGPIRIDVEYGDVLGGMVFDTDDPAVLQFDFLPNNP